MPGRRIPGEEFQPAGLARTALVASQPVGLEWNKVNSRLMPSTCHGATHVGASQDARAMQYRGYELALDDWLRERAVGEQEAA
jgi:hypothetical protein